MVYAPVVIPTLNRSDHLKRCLESLGKNTGAEFTEVFVSVDYPPAEKYVAGYNQVREMLQNMDFSCFKKIHIIYQKENLGSINNSSFLEKKAAEISDRCIYSEDDNEFAPNFLEYINKGLEMFEADTNVIAICGSRDTTWKTENQSVVYTKLYAAYGVGFWFQKGKIIDEDVAAVLLPERIYGPKVMWKLLKRNRCLFNEYVLGVICSDYGFFWSGENRLRYCDSIYSIYMHLTDAVCIAPALAKSRTWGNDGSGENMPKTDLDPEKSWPLDSNQHFSYPAPDKLRYFQENYSLGDAYMSEGQGLMTIKAILAYCVVLLCNRKRERVLCIAREIKKRIQNRKN